MSTSDDKKSKISADGTYIFDADDLDELDDISLTSVMSDVADSIKEKIRDSKAELPDIEESIYSDDHSDSLPADEQEDSITSMIESSDALKATGGDSDSRAEDENKSEPLVSPEILFPDVSKDKGGTGS